MSPLSAAVGAGFRFRTYIFPAFAALNQRHRISPQLDSPSSVYGGGLNDQTLSELIMNCGRAEWSRRLIGPLGIGEVNILVLVALLIRVFRPLVFCQVFPWRQVFE